MNGDPWLDPDVDDGMIVIGFLLIALCGGLVGFALGLLVGALVW